MCAAVASESRSTLWQWNWGVARKRGAEALGASFFPTPNSISHLLPAGRESVQYLFCFCFTLNL